MAKQQMTRRVFAALLAGAVGGIAGCSNTKPEEKKEDAQEQEQAKSWKFTDSCGREVEIPAKVEKIAPSGPLAQQVIIAIAPKKLCGLANDLGNAAAYFPDVPENLPKFGAIYGGKGDFNKEAVADAAPDLVIDIGEAKKTIKEDMDNLQQQLGIPCVHVESSLSTYSDAYANLGKLLGEEDRAKVLGEYCKNAYDEVNAVVSGLSDDKRVKAAYLLGDSGLNGMARGSFQAGVIDMVANNCIVVDKPTGSGAGNELNLEQIANFDPELIVFGPKSIYQSVGDDAAWADIAAIKNKNYYQVPSKPYNWLSGPPSVNQIMGLQWFARLCYAEQFNTSAEDVTKTYYKTFYNYELKNDEVKDLLSTATKQS